MFKKYITLFGGWLRPSLIVTSVEADFASIEQRPPPRLPIVYTWKSVKLYVCVVDPKRRFSAFFRNADQVYCCWGCSKTIKDGVSLHLFPADPKYRRLWAAKVRLTRAKWSGIDHAWDVYKPVYTPGDGSLTVACDAANTDFCCERYCSSTVVVGNVSWEYINFSLYLYL